MKDTIQIYRGGLTRFVDRQLIFVVRAIGVVAKSRPNRWLARSGNVTTIHPGDTIVVPMKIDGVWGLELWSQASRTTYQAAIAVAAVS